MSADLWCAGWVRDGHRTDLTITSTAPVPLCQVCHLAWLRDDRRPGEVPRG